MPLAYLPVGVRGWPPQPLRHQAAADAPLGLQRPQWVQPTRAPGGWGAVRGLGTPARVFIGLHDPTPALRLDELLRQRPRADVDFELPPLPAVFYLAQPWPGRGTPEGLFAEEVFRPVIHVGVVYGHCERHGIRVVE